MSVKTDHVNLDVTINSDPARKQLGLLDEQARALKASMKDMSKVTQEYIDTSKQYDDVKAKMTALKDQIGITGMTMKELNAELKGLTAVKNTMIPGTIAFHEMETKILEVKARIAELNEGVKVHESAWKDLKNQMAGFTVASVAANAISTGLEHLKDFAKECVEAWMEADLTAKKLAFTLKIQLGEEGVAAFQDLTEYSEKLSKALNNVFRPEEIQIAEQQLAQFGFTTEKIKELLPLITDLASAKNISLAESTEMVIRGTEGFGRSLKDLRIHVAGTMTEEENLDNIVKGLEKSVKGQAATMAGTAAGEMKQYENSWHELKEAVGGYMMQFTGIASKTIVEDAKQNFWGKMKGFAVDFAAFVPVTIAKMFVKTKEAAEPAVEYYKRLYKDQIAQFTHTEQKYTETITEEQKKRLELYKKYFNEVAILDHGHLSEHDNEVLDKKIKAKEEELKKEEELQKKEDDRQKRVAADKAKILKEVHDLTLDLAADEKTKNLAKLQEKYEDEVTATDANLELQKKALARGEINEADYQLFLKESAQKKLLLEANFLKDKNEMHKKLEKEYADVEYKLATDQLGQWHEKERLSLAQQLASKKISEAQYNEFSAALEKKFLDDKLQLQIDYGQSTVEAEKEIANKVIKTNKETSARQEKELLASLALKVRLSTQGSQARLDAEIALMKAEMTKELDDTSLTESEKAMIKNDWLAKIHQIETDYAQKGKDLTAKHIKEVEAATKNLMSIVTEIENGGLAHDKRINEEKKKNFKAMLDAKKISKAVYDKDIAAADDAIQKEERKVKHDQAIRDKIYNAFETAINTWVAASAAQEKDPTGITAALVVAEGAAMEAKILAAPIPELASGGYTGPGSGSRDSTGFKPAGLVHEHEWVAPKWMLENPVTADYIGTLEAIRKTGFSGGGYVSPPASRAIGSPSGSGAAANPTEMIEMLGKMHSVMDKIHAHLENPPPSISIIPDETIRDFNRRGSKLSKMQNDASF